MKASYKGPEQSHNINLKGLAGCSCRCFIFICLLLTLRLPLTAAGDFIESGQLDPADFITTLSQETSAEVKAPNMPSSAAAPGDWTAAMEITPGRPDIEQTPITISAAANFTARSDEQLPRNGLSNPAKPDSRAIRQLQLAEVAAPKSRKESAEKKRLQQIIEDVRSVEFKSSEKTSGPAAGLEPALTDSNRPEEAGPGVVQESPVDSPAANYQMQTPAAAGPSGGARQEQAGGELEAAVTYEPVTEQTLQIIADTLQQPDQLNNPFELGEVLFLSNHLRQAAVLYRQALNRIEPSQTDLSDERAWILFQTGNCLRNIEPQAAMKMYSQLITEYPESPWTGPAKVRNKLLDWYQKDKPKSLLAIK